VSPALLLIILFVVVMYVLVMRPQRRRRMTQQDMLSALAEGDEIVTAGGLYGTVQRVGDDDISLEVAPGIEVRVAKRAVAGVVSEPPAEDELEDEDEQAEETSGEPAEATGAEEEAS
jgi:preprotein translocase subunit YajC